MPRKEFVPVFEEDESVIRERILNRLDDTWRKEKGDFMYDAVATVPIEIKQGQIQRDYVLMNAFPQYAEGEHLDDILNASGLTRGQATANKRQLGILADAGVSIPSGHTASVIVLDNDGNPLEFTVDSTVDFTANETKTVEITCETVGKIGNVPTGTEFILLPPIPGVRSIADLGTTMPGSEEETDENAFNRLEFKEANPDTGGNKNDYKRWSEEVTGIGKVKVLPRWNGNGTVKVIAVDANYEIPSQALINDLQEYLDPGSQGLGEGKAPCGAVVTAVAANDVAINITANVTYKAGADTAKVKAKFENAFADYLKGLLTTAWCDTTSIAGYTVYYNKVGGLLSMTEGIDNYVDLQLNNGTEDIAVGPESVATPGTVNI